MVAVKIYNGSAGVPSVALEIKKIKNFEKTQKHTHRVPMGFLKTIQPIQTSRLTSYIPLERLQEKLRFEMLHGYSEDHSE